MTSHNYVDIQTLDQFYQSPLGQAASTAIAQRIKLLWPAPAGDMVGLGYSPPVLNFFSDYNIYTHAMMPERQGVIRWPLAGKSKAALVNEYNLPLRDSSVEYIILLHVLEHAHRPEKLLREIWRVLAPGGRIIVVVPNRRRIWSSLERTPFGYGRPYSSRQLERLLADKMLTPTRKDHALFLPPFNMPAVETLFMTAEWSARGWMRRWGGVLIMEAEKKVYGSILKPLKAPKAVPVPRAGTIPKLHQKGENKCKSSLLKNLDRNCRKM